jgi:hypothetical protein
MPPLLGAVGVYMLLGIPVAIAYLVRGHRRVDGAPITLAGRLLIFPGCCALWPVLVAQWARAPKGASS